MSDVAAKQPKHRSEVVEDRRSRSNEVLRTLVDEMLDQVRKLSRRTAAWSPEERAQAEAELEMIMTRVRREAVGAHQPDK
jgi:hypothetical protein